MPAPSHPNPGDQLLHLPTPDALTAGAAHLADLLLFEDMDSDPFDADLHRLVAALDTAGARTIADVKAKAGAVLSDLVGVSQLHRYADRRTAHEANRLRNTLLACLAALTHALGGRPRAAVGLAPAVMPRGTGGRAATDDEILLLRLAAVADAERGGCSHSRFLTYVLTEAGARTGETTAIRFTDLDDIRRPSTADLPGNHFLRRRTVPLPAWSAAPLARVLDRMLANSDEIPNRPLTYTGSDRPGGPVASASACGMLRNHLRDSGLDTKALDPEGITRWRIEKVRRQQSLEAARRIHGGRSLDAVMEYTRRPVDPTPARPDRLDLLSHLPTPRTIR